MHLTVCNPSQPAQDCRLSALALQRFALSRVSNVRGRYLCVRQVHTASSCEVQTSTVRGAETITVLKQRALKHMSLYYKNQIQHTVQAVMVKCRKYKGDPTADLRHLQQSLANCVVLRR